MPRWRRASAGLFYLVRSDYLMRGSSMENVILKGTDLKVSRLCFGTMTFGGQVDAAGAQAMVDRCLTVGINFFDTANVYTQGASETLLGQALKGRRKQVVLASKVGMTGPEVSAERRL